VANNAAVAGGTLLGEVLQYSQLQLALLLACREAAIVGSSKKKNTTVKVVV
jgi:hypothetical protein